VSLKNLRQALLGSVSRLALERALASHAFAAACDVTAERNNSTDSKERAPGVHTAAGPRSIVNNVTNIRRQPHTQ
jgi:hypothetical protein